MELFDDELDDFLYNCSLEKKLLEQRGYTLSEGKYKYGRMFYNVSKHECPFAKKQHKKAPLYIVLNPDYTGEIKCRKCKDKKQCFSMENLLPPDLIADMCREVNS